MLGEGFNADFKGVESVEPDGVLDDDVELNDELAMPDVEDEPLRPPLPLLLGPRDIAESVDENSEIVCVEGEERKDTDRLAGSADDEDADEETKLTRADKSPGLRYHSAFLDDDAPSATEPPTHYKDEPDVPPREPERRSQEGAPSSPSGSGDGSWEHASETR